MPNVHLSQCTLIFGENGWGKSTLADLFRSVSNKNSDILIGRKTLGSEGEQFAALNFRNGHSQFVKENWTGHKPKVVVYDTTFINENIYSGDMVSLDHMKNQYGLVVGEEGVSRIRRIAEIDDENRVCNNAIKSLEQELQITLKGSLPSDMRLEDFIILETKPNIDELLNTKKAELDRVNKAREFPTAKIPTPLELPQLAPNIESLFLSTLEDVGNKVTSTVRDHIKEHKESPNSSLSHESWIEIGLDFIDGNECAFCGQELNNNSLFEAYKIFFGKTYQNLAHEISLAREHIKKIQNEFERTTVMKTQINDDQFHYWCDNAQMLIPQLPATDESLNKLKILSKEIELLLTRKLENITQPISEELFIDLLAQWNIICNDFVNYNAAIQTYNIELDSLKKSLIDPPISRLENEYLMLLAYKKRSAPECNDLIKELHDQQSKKTSLSQEKQRLRKELNTHGQTITENMGKSINSYLKRLNAGFRIEYFEPDYKGKEPAASYHIIINEQPIHPKGVEIYKPSFRNTLSAGDKSTLALAFFLAKLYQSKDLNSTIVVLDDPFTSQDEFRRHFTAIEIKKLCSSCAQTIVLSHDKMFLRLLWDKIDRSIISSLALQTGSPGISTIAPFDIELETKPRHVTERMEIQEFVEGEEHSIVYIRTRLRTVCEDFYRRGDPKLFNESATLDEIIRRLEKADSSHPYKGALDDLKEINCYSRTDNHAAIEGDPSTETSKEELLGFCRMVLNLTHGM
ncbi:AAA family ATPase [Legionella sp. 16cNR16C]|uniref:AAA family ATPase n=1 Tax=Legionella sp. 16cNR16C TaxID=2905656 RepID=UPI00351D3B12